MDTSPASLALDTCTSDCTLAALGKPRWRAEGPVGVGRRRSKARGFDVAGTLGQGPAGLGPSLPLLQRTWLRDTVPAGQGTGSSEPAGQ